MGIVRVCVRRRESAIPSVPASPTEGSWTASQSGMPSPQKKGAELAEGRNQQVHNSPLFAMLKIASCSEVDYLLVPIDNKASTGWPQWGLKKRASRGGWGRLVVELAASVYNLSPRLNPRC